MLKKLAIVVAIVASTASAMENSALMVPSRLGNVSLFHDEEHGFSVVREQGIVPVQRAHMDKELRGLSNEKLMGLVKAGGYLKLNQMDNKDYTLKIGHRLPGGGPGGAAAGFWIGATLTNVVGHSVLWGISLFAGPASPGVGTGLSYTFAAPIMAASKAVGVGCGIIGGIITGPV